VILSLSLYLSSSLRSAGPANTCYFLGMAEVLGNIFGPVLSTEMLNNDKKFSVSSSTKVTESSARSTAGAVKQHGFFFFRTFVLNGPSCLDSMGYC
jgi:hypothetical protein